MLPLGGGADAFGAEFAHASPAWRDLAPTVCYLSEQHRQSDAAFLDVLAAIRSNACVGTHRERLASRLIGRDQLPAACTRLFTHNAAVDDINQQQLAKLPGKAHIFGMITKGPEPFVRTLQRGCLSPERLELKQGAVVMFTKNDPAGRYVNGTLGVVDDFDPRTVTRWCGRAAASAFSLSPQNGRSTRTARSARASLRCRSSSPGR